jgi:putative hydrolase of the HAD superfamily
MRARPALLLFDLDDVLVRYDHGLRCAALARALGGRVPVEEVRRVLFGPDGLEFGCDRGEYDLPGYLARLRDAQGWTLDAEAFVAAREAATRLDLSMLVLLMRLESQARLAVFSNNGAWIAEHAARIVAPLHQLFPGRIVCSGQLGLSKPEPTAFLACLEHLGATPGETLFIDDKAANAEGARAAGLDAVHFTGEPALRRDLRARGFDLPPEVTRDPEPAS